MTDVVRTRDRNEAGNRGEASGRGEFLAGRGEARKSFGEGKYGEARRGYSTTRRSGDGGKFRRGEAESRKFMSRRGGSI